MASTDDNYYDRDHLSSTGGRQIMIRSFLPDDTRSVELVSGCSLLLCLAISALITYLNPSIGSSGTLTHYNILAIGWFGLIQIFVCTTAHMRSIRAIVNWVTGSYWIWVGSHELMINPPALLGALSVILGMSCLYAFVVNVLKVRR
jgi:hypothetical protein